MKNEKKKEVDYISSAVLSDGSLVEMVFDKANFKTQFIQCSNGKIEKVDEVEIGGKKYLPVSAYSNLLKTDTVLFPSDAVEYGTEPELISEVKNFIHKYLGISSFFEEMATFYVLFTWVYDCFNELPYLRVLADYGCGKSRFLRTIGSICYKPMFTAGATSVSPIFRIIDTFRGTLILDEADMKFSDTKSEIIKILNCGFSKGTPVMRSEEKRKGAFDIRSFDVYCPKILATRERFYDKALESRCLIEEMDSINLREDIPINLPGTFQDEATAIRNKLLMWRFKNYGEKAIDPSLTDRSLEPRLNQILLPLITIIKDESLRARLKEFVGEHNRQLIQDRGFSIEADILAVIFNKIGLGYVAMTMKEIADTHNAGLQDFEKKITAKKAGQIIREKLKLKTERTREGYVVNIESDDIKQRLANLAKKYDITVENGERVNLENIAEDANREITVEDIPY